MCRSKRFKSKNIVDELIGEKIDIINYSENPAEFISAALSPSKVVRVDVNEEEKSALVVVPDYQLSLAIGKEGQNARLAAKLTNWKIDIKVNLKITKSKGGIIFAKNKESTSKKMHSLSR